MSPSNFDATSLAANELVANSTGYAYQYGYVTYVSGVRPVINLASDTQITGGIGTANDPFVVKIA